MGLKRFFKSLINIGHSKEIENTYYGGQSENNAKG